MKLVSGALALSLCLVSQPGSAALCTLDQVPGASLLMPYFEVSTDCAAAQPERGAVFKITNTAADSVLSHVTLWTNAGVVALDFDVYLAGYDQQTVDLRSLLCAGVLPSTGIALATQGRSAAPLVNFAGCNATGSSAGGAPVYAPLSANQQASLRAALTGEADPQNSTCSGIYEDGRRMVGYVTVDATSACTLLAPFSAGYDTVLADSNVLIGSMVLEDYANNSSIGYAAVALEAAPGGELAGSYGFYGLGQHPREPLPTAWNLDRRDIGLFASEFIVWRGASEARQPFICGTLPAQLPLNLSNTSGYDSRGVFHVSDSGQPVEARTRAPFPFATQRVAVGAVFPEVAGSSGYTFVNLEHDRQASGTAGSQAWAATVSSAAGRFSSLSVGQPVGGACATAAFDNTSPGDNTLPPAQ